MSEGTFLAKISPFADATASATKSMKIPDVAAILPPTEADLCILLKILF